MNINGIPTLILCLFLFGTLGLEGRHLRTERTKDSLALITVIQHFESRKSRDLDSLKTVLAQSLEKARKLHSTYFEKSFLIGLSTTYSDIGGTDNYAKSIAYAMEALTLGKHIADGKTEFNALIQLSSVYRRLNNLPKALTYGIRAVRISNNTERFQDLHRGMSRGNLGNLYFRLQLYDSAIVYLKKSKTILRPLNDRLANAAANNIGTCYMELSQIPLAIPYFEEAYAGYEENGQQLYVAMVAENLGNCYLKLASYHTAERHLSESFRLAEQLGSKRQQMRSAIYLSKLYNVLDQTDSALYYVDLVGRTIDSLGTLDEKYEYIKQRERLLEKTNDSVASQLKYHKWALRLKDSLEKHENIPKTTSLLLSAKEVSKTRQISRFEKKLSGKKRVILVIGCGMAILGIYLFFVKRKHVQKQRKATRNLNSVISEKERLNRKVTRYSASMSVNNEMMDRLSLKLNEIVKEERISEKTKRLIRATRKDIGSNLKTNQLWGEFFAQFEETHPGFTKHLVTIYNVTPTELKICCFLKMNISLKDMASMMHIQYASVRQGLFRLKKKLGLPKDQSVFEFIHSV